ncbi:MAG: AtpZ/AtpI family protein [Pseudomonadota bacterium]
MGFSIRQALQLTPLALVNITSPDPQEIEVSDPERLKALNDRLAAAQERAAPREPKPDASQDMSDNAWRMVLELVVGIAFGFGIGLGLDTLFGTMPIFLVTFTLFGFGGGVSMMLRTAKEVQRMHAEPESSVEENKDG